MQVRETSPTLYIGGFGRSEPGFRGQKVAVNCVG